MALVALRAARLARRGWDLGEAASLGLLDPRGGPARERWAVRRAELAALQERLCPAGAGPMLIASDPPSPRARADVRRLSGGEGPQPYRVLTLLDEAGRARVLLAVLRLDSGAGPLTARVQGDGTLAVPVVPSPGGFGLTRVARHPESEVVLAGAPAPGWHDARELALVAAEGHPRLRAGCWDVAVTGGGPCLVAAPRCADLTPDPDGALAEARDALRAVADRPATGYEFSILTQSRGTRPSGPGVGWSAGWDVGSASGGPSA
jgi:hypothetical protein